MSACKHDWQCHPRLPVLACPCGAVAKADGAPIKTRPDKDGYRLFDLRLGKGLKVTLKAHRVVIACFETERDDEVDHIDRDRSNNALANLRYAGRSANRRNVGVRSHSRSGIRNVRFRKGRWQAYRTEHGKFISLGTYDTAEEAIAVAEKHYVG